MDDKINTPLKDEFGTVTPDGKFFFFHRFTSPGKADIFWVNAQFVEALRPE